MKNLWIHRRENQTNFAEKLLLNIFKKTGRSQPPEGFTLLELLVVIAIAAILAAIAAPGWLSFTNQQRVNVVREEIFRALQDAQREARTKKLSYSVSLRIEPPGPTNNNQATPQIAIHQDTARVADLTPNSWRNLGIGSGVQPNQIILYSNLRANTDPPSPQNAAPVRNRILDNVAVNTYPQPTPPDGPITITFDQQGILAPLTSPILARGNPPRDVGLLIGVGMPSSPGSIRPTIGSQRCVVVTTLLGAMEARQGEQCNPWPTP
ncbi:MAG: prepilin-type N-terminal cleavage/methylation domain-containing protein [Desertifilum sp.]|nr:prepilin-type N-terminal cleavage/methylation domain-containing protein [Desertifilum sp.]